MTTNNPRLASKRQILFQEGKSVDEMPEQVKKEAKQGKSIEPKKSSEKNEVAGGTLEGRTISIYKWLSTHRLVNLNKLCEMCSIDRANFIKGVAANKVIKQEVLEKFEAALKLYGYGK